jgi:choline dehydrogenase-like flavoprotein
MEHLHTSTGYPSGGWFIPSDPHQCQQFALYRMHKTRGTVVLGYLALSDQAMRREELPNYCTELRPELEGHWRKHTSAGYKALRRLVLGIKNGQPVEHPLRAAVTATTGAPDIARIAYHKMRKRFHHRAGHTPVAESYKLFQMTEQVPNPESRVLLSDEQDALGQPRARLHWQLQPQDTRSIQRSQQVLDRALRRAGVGRVHVASLDAIERESVRGGYHHMGTTRMGATPQEGVVDGNCKIHGVENTYVAGSSVFTTAGCANPTLTIAALSLRLADHLKKKRGGS